MAAQTLPLTHPKASLWSRMGNARRYIMITTVILVLMLIIVLIGSKENTVGDIVASFIATTFTFATPLTLGALSGIYCERSDISCPIIFTTAYDAYALQAFKVNAVDYLLKPIKNTELAAALEKHRKLFKPGQMPDYSGLLDTLRQQQDAAYLHRLLIRFGQSLKLVDLTEAVRELSQPD